MSEERKAEETFEEESMLGKISKERKRQQDIRERIRQEMMPTRQKTPPQYGRSAQETEMDEEGNQDTLE